ncbi:MAG: Zn-dependent hydrolase [Bacteroidia bacterium]
MKKYLPFLLTAPIAFFSGCDNSGSDSEQTAGGTDTSQYISVAEGYDIEQLLNKYVSVELTADLSSLTNRQKQMIPLLIEASQLMDEIFWTEAFGGQDTLLPRIEDEAVRKFVNINYGPWDRLNNNEPFIQGYGAKPLTANFYPAGLTREEFEASSAENKNSQYTLIRRSEDGSLKSIWYHEAFTDQNVRAADLLLRAAELAEDKGLRNYLSLRADALLNDQYRQSDMAWLDMKDNTLDIVIGPIENYEDKLMGLKAAHEAYVLVKDKEWSSRLSKYAAMLPSLQEGLPVAARYKAEKPGTDSELNAYDVIFYAGDCNAGSKTIAINLPNDEQVQLEKGTRRLQLKNAMQAKFEKILIPVSQELIAEDQQQHITFDAFFANTMFHEVAHGLGIKNTLDGTQTVREALQEHASALEEGKADILGLYMVTELHEQGEIKGALEEYYVTFMASIFRSVRFGAASAHGKANMLRFNYFRDAGAFTRDPENGRYRVDMAKMQAAMNSLSEKILMLQGDGDKAGTEELMQEIGSVSPQLQEDLDRLTARDIPVDIVFEQGVKILGLDTIPQ